MPKEKKRTTVEYMETLRYIFETAYPEIPRYEKELLAAHVLGVSREHVVAHGDTVTPSQEEHSRITQLFEQRSDGVPIAYLLGKKAFFGRDFAVDERVLIPRPETEILVEHAIKHVRTLPDNSKPVILDIGTGSGAIAISIAHHVPNARIAASDISQDALEAAGENARMHGVSDRITFFRSDLLENIPLVRLSILRSPLCILLNLPYLPAQAYETAPIEEATRGIRFEPAAALVSGGDGLDHYRALFRQLLRKRNELPDHTALLLEHFGDKTHRTFFRETVPAMLPGTRVETFPDLAGCERFAKLSWRPLR